jgi:cyclin-C
MNTALLCTYNGILKFFRGLVNDTYKMDLILIYPPYMIALACIYIASVLKDKDTTAWFEELRVDMNVVRQTASPNPGHYILYLY